MQTRRDEIVRTLTTSEEIMKSAGMYFKEHVCKVWTEDFVDEDTGAIVPIERKEIIFEKGCEIDPATVPQLLFYFQSGEFSQIVISNQRRAAFEVNYGQKSYLATVEIRKKKKKFLFKAPSVYLAIEGLKDFIELSFNGGFRVVSVKEFQTSILLDDTLQSMDEATQDEESIEDDKFYQITVSAIFENAFVNDVEAVVKSKSLEKAMVLFENTLKSTYKDEKFTVKLEEAVIIKVDYFIEDEFMKAYEEK